MWRWQCVTRMCRCRAAVPWKRLRAIARYAVLKSQLRPGELLLTAQHADDQLETVLLALLRGAGPAGLAAMPAVMPFGAGKLLRPLLELDRATLLNYVNAAGLQWIEDPTNAQLRHRPQFPARGSGAPAS